MANVAFLPYFTFVTPAYAGACAKPFAQIPACAGMTVRQPQARNLAMMKDSKLFDDLSKMASSAAGSVMDMKREVEAMVQAKIDAWIARSQLVTREEFEVVRDMAQKARSENEALKAEIAALKAKNTGL